MKIGVVSDIHCNADGLKAAFEALHDAEEIFCLGDSIFEYRFSNEVVSLLRDRRAHIIQGNHEEVFFSAAGIRARTSVANDPELVAFLCAQPASRHLHMCGKRLLLVHSTPWAPKGEYVFPHSSSLQRFAATDADIVFYGHTHHQLAQRIGTVLVVNPGSAGHGRDYRNGRLLSCACIDLRSEEVAITNFPDPSGPATRS